MLKEYITIYKRLTIFADLCIVALSFFAGIYLRSKFHEITPLNTYIGLLPILFFIWGALLYFLGAYDSFRTRRLIDVLFVVFKASILGFITFSSFIFLFKLYYVSRPLIVFVFVFSTVVISIEKAILITFFRYIRKRGHNFRRVLIVGTGKRAQRLIDLLHRHDEWGFRIIGLVDEDVNKKGEEIKGHRVLGSFKDVSDIIDNNVVDDVVFVVPRSWLNKIEKLIYFCEMEGLKVSVAVDYFKPKISKTKQTELGEIPFLTFVSTPDKFWHLLIKRFIDVVFSAVALIVLAPFFLIITALIKTTSKGPIFFKQKRCSLNGRRFLVCKFRTMCVGAEAERKSLLQYNEMNGPVFKITNDPRITKIGKILRKFSIDELPQFWNVFKGDMSLVGPRPLPTEENNYDFWQRRRLSVKPGLTCLWQINGRNRIADFDEWAKLDLEYIDNWSLGLDFKILFKTIPAVLFTRGAK